MDGKKTFGLVLIILAVLLHFITSWPWWIKLVVLVIGIVMLLCKCKKCVKKETDASVEEKKPEVEENVEEPKVKEEPQTTETPEISEETAEEVVEENSSDTTEKVKEEEKEF